MSKDFNKAFRKVIDSNFIRFRGCLIEKNQGGYMWGNNWFSSLKQCEDAIDAAHPILGNSINRKKH